MSTSAQPNSPNVVVVRHDVNLYESRCVFAVDPIPISLSCFSEGVFTMSTEYSPAAETVAILDIRFRQGNAWAAKEHRRSTSTTTIY
jgi:hypothetical protein